jgi:hypothetical protein
MRVEFGIGKYFFNLLANLASVFSSSQWVFFSPANWVLFLPGPILKYKYTHDTVIYVLLWHTHSHDGLFFE